MMSEEVGKHILVVGATCLDIINFCDEYPDEDSDTRANNQIWQKGGNAANTCEVLQQLGVHAYVMSTIGVGQASSAGRYLLDELQSCGIDSSLCQLIKHCGCPTSTCIVSKNTGSRTIVHSRNDLPELKCSDFANVELSQFSWIHFEGRGFPDVLEMLRRAASFNKSNHGSATPIKLSFELEKPRCVSCSYARSALCYADVVYISKDVSRVFGFSDAKSTVMNLKRITGATESTSVVICPWGEMGCDAVDASGNHYHADALKLDTPVDSLGAGDTFIAGVASMLLKGSSLQEALEFGCTLASKKCSQRGFKNLNIQLECSSSADMHQ